MDPANSPEHPDCGIACRQVGLTQTVPEGFLFTLSALQGVGAALSYMLVCLLSQSHVTQML